MARNNFIIGFLLSMLIIPAQAWSVECFDPADEGFSTFTAERTTGISMYENGRYMEAIPHLEKAYGMCPKDSILNEYLYFAYKYTLRTMDANRLFSGVSAASVSLYGLKRSKPVSSLYAEGGALFADSKTAWDDSYIYFERYLVGNGGFASVDMTNELGDVCELNHHVGFTSRTNPVEMKGSNATYFNLKSKYVGVEYEVSAKFNVSSRWKVMPYGRISRESYDEVRFALDTMSASSTSDNPFSMWNFPWDLHADESDKESESSPSDEGNTILTPVGGNEANEGPNEGEKGTTEGNNNYWQNEWPVYNPVWNNPDAKGDNSMNGQDENSRNYGYDYGMYNNYVGWYNPWWSYLYNPYGQYYGNYTMPEYNPQFWQSLSNSTYKYRHTSSRHSRMDYLVGCLVSYTYGKHVGLASASYFKGETLKTIQANLSYYIYPSGNLNLYISPKVSYIWRGNDYYPLGEIPGNWLGEVEIGGKLLKRLWGSVSYLYGNLCDFHDRESHTFYSLSCETKFRCSARFIYLLNTHCQLSLTYKYLRKESNLFLVDVDGNAGLNVFSQNDNVIAGGVQWNF